MARRKKGEKGCEEANERWRKTMMEKYGGAEGLHRRMQEMGSVGGRVATEKGFAKNRLLAKVAGAKGGRRSRRNAITVDERLDKHKEEIVRMVDYGEYYYVIAQKFGVSTASLSKWLKKAYEK